MEEFTLQPDRRFLEFLKKEVPKLYSELPEWKKNNLHASKLAMDEDNEQQFNKTC